MLHERVGNCVYIASKRIVLLTDRFDMRGQEMCGVV